MQIENNRLSNGLSVQGKQEPSIQTSGRSIKSSIPLSVSHQHMDSSQNGHLSSSNRQNFPRQIIDYRAMLNQETRLPLEENNHLSEDPQEFVHIYDIKSNLFEVRIENNKYSNNNNNNNSEFVSNSIVD
ncbi:unnamed protein product [Trichobilharzia regenti]|nr:unnamed protein product [Trichobilharzia regenti]